MAKLLGNAIATVETHYVFFVKELCERARQIMENGDGLESRVKIARFLQTRLSKMNKSNKISGRVCKPDSVRRCRLFRV